MDYNTVGGDCKAYYMSAGTWGSPTWTLIPGVQDLQLSSEINKIMAISRDSTHHRFLPGLLQEAVTFSLLRNKTNTTQAALRTAYRAKTNTIFAFADVAIATSGAVYFKAEFFISKWAESEPLEGSSTIDVELTLPATSSNAPTIVTV